MKKLFIHIVFLTSCFLASASVNQEIIADANKAYTENKFSVAIELYKKIISNGFESPELYYNLGNAYFKTNDYPSALLYYEKAKKLDPSNEKINYNINIANTKIIDKIEALPIPFYKRWWNVFQQWFSVDTWAILSIVFIFLFFVSLAVYLIGNTVAVRKVFFWLGIFFLVFTITSAGNAYSRYHNLQIVKEAIIFEPTVNVKSSPDAESQDIFVIHEGTKVKITDKVGTWIEIKIANGSDGWVQESVVEVI
ncbi:MAG: tetratricopeptide repeat protein [Bacteroidales bacterium]|jgi:tetratricopeptide (TPR) repeat protein|nr:tetratricopeptide repeat protein [Bacteroidales bacterium]MDD4213638.1 tetratricopeptide repeat protein [Bacteroidales bacterium]